MIHRKIDEDKYIVLIKNKYYVVNEFTKNLLNWYNIDTNLPFLSKKIGLTQFATKKLYKELANNIENIQYYDNNIDLSYPLKIQWRVTKKCNLRCKHCYLGDTNDETLSKEELFHILQEILNSSVFEVTITGGEALLVPFLPEIVQKLVEANIKVNIYTNGILLDKFISVISSKKIDKNFISFFVSVDGLRETHDYIRGKGNYDVLMNNLEYAIAQGYNITTNSVLTNKNFMQLPNLFLLLCDMGIDQIQISNIVEKGYAKGLRLNQEQHKWFINELSNSVDSSKKYSSLLYADMPDDFQSKVFIIDKGEKNFLQYEKWKCSAGIGKATIDSDGYVYCCPFLKESRLGNILEKSFQEIWASPLRFIFLKKLSQANNNSRVCLVLKEEQNTL